MEIHLTLIFMICASIFALEAKNMLSGLIALAAAGLGLSLSFLILQAPNLAITQIVIEIILVLILIRATADEDLAFIRDGRGIFNIAVTLFFAASFLVFVYFSLRELPAFGSPLMRVSAGYLDPAVAGEDIPNIVSMIVLKFRSLDALAEATVFFTALLGVLAISRKTGKLDDKE